MTTTDPQPPPAAGPFAEDLPRPSSGGVRHATEDHRRALPTGLDSAARARWVRRLRAEAELLESLAHPGVPRVVSVDLSPQARAGEGGLLLRRATGVTLAAVFGAVHGDRASGSLGSAGGRNWSFSGALNATVRLVEIVAQAHARDVIHRALSPAAAVVGEDGRVQLTDWRLARDLDRPDPVELGHDPAGELCTTEGDPLPPAVYLAPELRAAQQYQVGKPADVYALGAILWELLEGRPPGEPAGARRLHAVPGRGLRHGPLRAVARRALAPARHARPADARALLAELEDAIALGPTPDGALGGSSSWGRRNGRPLLVAGLVAAAAVALVQLRSEDERPREVLAAADEADPSTTTARLDPYAESGAPDASRDAVGTPPSAADSAPAVEAAQATAGDPAETETETATEAARGVDDEVAPDEPRIESIALRSVPVRGPRAAQPFPGRATPSAAVTPLPDSNPSAVDPALVDPALVDSDGLDPDGPADVALPAGDPGSDSLDGQADEVVTEGQNDPLDTTAAPVVAAGPAQERSAQPLAPRDHSLLGRRARYDDHRAAFGEDDSRTLEARRDLALALAEDGRSEDAWIHLHGTLALHDQDDALRLQLLVQFAALEAELDDTPAAIRRLEEAGSLAGRLGAGGRAVLDLADRLSAAALRENAAAPAAELLESALAALSGTADPAARTAEERARRTTLVQLYQRLARDEDALRHARALLASTPADDRAHGARQALVRSLEARAGADPDR